MINIIHEAIDDLLGWIRRDLLLQTSMFLKRCEASVIDNVEDILGILFRLFSTNYHHLPLTKVLVLKSNMSSINVHGCCFCVNTIWRFNNSVHLDIASIDVIEPFLKLLLSPTNPNR